MHTRSKNGTESRGKELGEAAKIPPVGDAAYLLKMLTDVGLYELGWQDIKAWSDLTGSTLTPWEATSMITLSKIYTKAVNEHDRKDTSAPWHDGIVDREAVAESVRSAFRSK